jgi:hypothetical protein
MFYMQAYNKFDGCLYVVEGRSLTLKKNMNYKEDSEMKKLRWGGHLVSTRS